MNKNLIASLSWGGGIVGLALAATIARKLGYIDGDTVIRVVVGINGLMIAWYGNRMPKAFVPSAGARQAARVGGWAMVLRRTRLRGPMAFAPIPVATIAGCGALIVGNSGDARLLPVAAG